MEPRSPIQALGVNPFPSRCINRRFPEEVSRADRGTERANENRGTERANENREMTVILTYVKQQAASAFIMRFKCITKECGFSYRSTRERVNSRN